VVEGFEPKRAMKMDGPEGKRSAGRSQGRGQARNDRNERTHKPGSGGYQPRGNGAERGRNASNRVPFGDRAAFNDAPTRRIGGENPAPARSFSDRPRSDRPRSDRNFSDRPRTHDRSDNTGNRTPRDNSGENSREINGNSRSYTKDTDMQFARELSKGFGSARPARNDAPRGSATAKNHSGATKISDEKFGKPRPQRSNDRSYASSAPSGDRAPRRPNVSNGADGARRSRSFA